MQNKNGFTLVELLVVVSIIVIIAAIAIPNFLRSRISANETSALASARQIATAQIAFKASNHFDSDGNGDSDYATFPQLHDPDGIGGSHPYIDEVLATGKKGGYEYLLTVTLGDLNNTPSFGLRVKPVSSGVSGVREYYVDDTGVLRTTLDGSEAGPDSPVLASHQKHDIYNNGDSSSSGPVA